MSSTCYCSQQHVKKFNLQLASCQTFWKSVVKKFNLQSLSSASEVLIMLKKKKTITKSKTRYIQQ